MAKLPEGMTLKRGNYSTEYFYKGVTIRKHRDNWTISEEYMASETGRIGINQKYIGWKLEHAPKEIDKILENPKYYLCKGTGVLRLTDEAKAQIAKDIVERTSNELEACKQKAQEYLEKGDWKALEITAGYIQRLQKHWTQQSESAVA